MRFIEFISNTAIIFFLLIILLYGIKEKKNIVNLFMEGVKDGVTIVYELFPTLLALIVAIGIFKSSGVLNLIGNILIPLFDLFGIDKNLIPLILIRPISGSTTTAMATNIMKNFGVDSSLGIISSCIMGATETTIYIASLYSSKVGIKNIKEVISIRINCRFHWCYVFYFCL